MQQRKELEARRHKLTTLAAQDATARKEAARQAQERLATISTLRERAAALHAQVATAVNALGTPPVPPTQSPTPAEPAVDHQPDPSTTPGG